MTGVGIATGDGLAVAPRQREVGLFLTRWGFPLTVAFVCAALAYFQPFGESRDFAEYDAFLDSLRGRGLDRTMLVTRYEPGFVLLVNWLSRYIGANALLLAAVAAITGGIKTRMLSVAGGTALGVFVAGMLFLVRFVPLHELTQSRAAVALMFLVVAVALRESGRVRPAIAAAVVAVSFHFSAAFVVPAIFLRATSRRRTLLFGALAMVGMAVALEVLIVVLGPRIAAVAMYQQVGFGDNAVNPFSPSILLDVAMCVAGLSLWRQLSAPMRQMLMLQLIGLGIFIGALGYPVFAHRIRELFAVFWIVYVALSFHRSRDLAIVASVFTVLSLGLYSYVYFFDPTDVYFR